MTDQEQSNSAGTRTQEQQIAAVQHHYSIPAVFTNAFSVSDAGETIIRVAMLDALVPIPGVLPESRFVGLMRIDDAEQLAKALMTVVEHCRQAQAAKAAAKAAEGVTLHPGEEEPAVPVN